MFYFVKNLFQVLCLVSLSAFLMGDHKAALKSAQKAVHCFPDIAESWAVLISALSLHSQVSKLKSLSDFVVNNLKCTTALLEWFQQFK